MKDLFENLLYIIPVAFFIVIRILNARNKSNQQQQSRESTKEIGEIFRRFREEEDRPVAERQQAEEAFPRTRVPDERKKKAEKKADRSVVRAPNNSELPSAQEKNGAQDKPGTLNKSAAPGLSGASAAVRLPAMDNLTRIQQAVVWSEILGHPKGFPEGV